MPSIMERRKRVCYDFDKWKCSITGYSGASVSDLLLINFAFLFVRNLSNVLDVLLLLIKTGVLSILSIFAVNSEQ